MAPTTDRHRIRWYVYAGRERIRHTATMRGQWAYDAECIDCGWDTRTGGAIRSYIENRIWEHKRGFGS
jgi:hypothetical protein